MPETRYDLYFSGKTMEGKDPRTVRSKIGSLFSASEQTLARLFSGDPVRVKSGVDQDTASSYRVAFREAGALLEIRAARSNEHPVVTASATADEAMTLLPPNTGSLIDYAPRIEPAVIADLPGIGLSPPGADMDTSPPPVPPVIDTSHLTAAPPRSGTLEDCQPQTPPAPIPDISALTIEEPEAAERRIDDLA